MLIPVIDVKRENLIALSDVPALAWMPKPGGQPLSPQTLHMWAVRGVRGVRLEVVSVGGVRATSEAALLRFMERLSPGQTAGESLAVA